MRARRSLLSIDPVPAGTNRFLRGGFAPVLQEREFREPLETVGHLPPELDGALLRNGPNPATVADPAGHDWCTGDGMVHAIELRAGKAVAYRNRWVRTWALSEQVGTPLPRGPVEPVDSPANAHVVHHAGRLLALAESGLPYRLSSDLVTREVWDFDGVVSSPVSPRPRVDPDTGGMTLFGYDCFGPPYLRYHELDAGGSVVHTTPVPVPRPTMQHDFGVTATRVVFLDLPAVYDVELARRGVALPFRWTPDAGARLGVLPRGRVGSETCWFAIEPRFAYHVMNAHDVGEHIVVDVCRHDVAFDLAPPRAPVPVLERWEIDPAGGRVTTTQLDDMAVEWPRVDDRLAGRPHRFGYCATPPGAPGAGSGPLVRYDLAHGLRAVWDPGPGRVAGEPVFVRGSGGRADDEGWVLSLVYDAAEDTSSLVVLDASSFGGGPEAIVALPFRVPVGCHGSWVPRDHLAGVV